MQNLIALYFRLCSRKLKNENGRENKQFQVTACCGDDVGYCNAYMHQVLRMANRIKELQFMTGDAELKWERHEVAGQ